MAQKSRALLNTDNTTVIKDNNPVADNRTLGLSLRNHIKNVMDSYIHKEDSLADYVLDKGFFETEADLNTAYPTGQQGWFARVANEAVPTDPAHFWTWNTITEVWQDSGVEFSSNNTVLNGSGAPSSGAGNLGDFYINTAAWTIYGPKGVGGWGSSTSLIGPAGADGVDGVDGTDGIDGTNGSQIFTASGTPSNSTGSNNDIYINTANGDLYKKISGAWSLQLNIKGPQGNPGEDGEDGVDGTNGTNGTNGSTWTQGTGAPSNGSGANGDFYLRTSTGDIYYKSGGVWMISMNIYAAIATNSEFDANNSAKAATPHQVNTRAENTMDITIEEPELATGLTMTADKAKLHVFANWVVSLFNTLGGYITGLISSVSTLSTELESKADDAVVVKSVSVNGGTPVTPTAGNVDLTVASGGVSLASDAEFNAANAAKAASPNQIEDLASAIQKVDIPAPGGGASDLYSDIRTVDGKVILNDAIQRIDDNLTFPTTTEQLRRKLDVPYYMKASVLEAGVATPQMLDITNSTTKSQNKARVQQYIDWRLGSASFTSVPANGYGMSASELADLTNERKQKWAKILFPPGYYEIETGIVAKSGLSLIGVNKAMFKGGVATSDGHVSGTTIGVTDTTDSLITVGGGVAGLHVEGITIDYPNQNLGTGTYSGAIQYKSTFKVNTGCYSMRFSDIQVIGGYDYVIESIMASGVTSEATADWLIENVYFDTVTGRGFILDRVLDIPRIHACHQSPSMGNYAKTVPSGRPCLTSADIIEGRFTNGGTAYEIRRTDQAMMQECFSFGVKYGFKMVDSDVLIDRCNGDMTMVPFYLDGTRTGRGTIITSSYSFMYGGTVSERNFAVIASTGLYSFSQCVPMLAASGAVATSGATGGANALIKVLNSGTPVVDWDCPIPQIPSGVGQFSYDVQNLNANAIIRRIRGFKILNNADIAGGGGFTYTTIYEETFTNAGPETGAASDTIGGFTRSAGLATATASPSRRTVSTTMPAQRKYTLQVTTLASTQAALIVVRDGGGGALYVNFYQNGASSLLQIVNSAVSAGGGVVAQTTVTYVSNALIECSIVSGVIYAVYNSGTVISYTIPGTVVTDVAYFQASASGTVFNYAKIEQVS